MHCPKCGSIINEDSEVCKFCKIEIKPQDRPKVEKKKAQFTWFNWLILIVSAPLMVIGGLLAIANLPSIFTGSRDAYGSILWAAIFIAAFIYEIRLYKEVKKAKNDK